MSEKQWISFRNLGDFIRKVRKAKGLSQEELAERMKISNGAVSYTENMGESFSLTTANDMLIELAGVRVELPTMKVPIVEAQAEHKISYEKRKEARVSGESPKDLPPVPTGDERMKTAEDLEESGSGSE